MARRKPAPKSCPTLTIKCSGWGEDSVECLAYAKGSDPSAKALGEMHLMERSIRHRNPGSKTDGKLERMLEVSYIRVYGSLRCGVGTQLYEKALKIACHRGVRLASDEARTADSQGFWQKQTRKGRASCISRSEGGGTRLTPQMDPSGRWGCARFAMKAACLTSPSLAGRRG